MNKAKTTGKQQESVPKRDAGNNGTQKKGSASPKNQAKPAAKSSKKD